MDQDVLFADRGEAVAGVIPDPFREPRLEGAELQFRPVRRDQLGKLVEAQQPLDPNNIVAAGVQVGADEVLEVTGHVGLDLHPDHRAQPALLETLLELADEILGLLLDLDVGIADQPEDAPGLDPRAGKQPVHEEGHEAFQRKKAPLRPAAGPGLGRQFPEPGDLGGNRDEGIERAPLGLEPQLEDQGKGQVRDEGKRVRRVDGEGRQYGKEPVLEGLFQGLAVTRRQGLGADDAQPLGGKLP